MAGRGDVVNDDIARLARAREFELAFRTPPLASRADLSCYRHIVHRHPPLVHFACPSGLTTVGIIAKLRAFVR